MQCGERRVSRERERELWGEGGVWRVWSLPSVPFSAYPHFPLPRHPVTYSCSLSLSLSHPPPLPLPSPNIHDTLDQSITYQMQPRTPMSHKSLATSTHATTQLLRLSLGSISYSIMFTSQRHSTSHTLRDCGYAEDSA